VLGWVGLASQAHFDSSTFRREVQRISNNLGRIAKKKFNKYFKNSHPAGWPLRLAGWAYEASGPNEVGLKSLVPKWAEKIEPKPI